MIAELTGTITEVSKEYAVISLSGIGFEVRVSASLLTTLREGLEVHLYTRLTVREDGWTLYGFRSREERTLFDLLRTVSGVGPKVALRITEIMSTEEFYRAVLARDEDALKKVPGIGKKTAGRIILELRDRIGLRAKKGDTKSSFLPQDELVQACEALQALGYSWSEAKEALESAVKSGISGDLETMLKEALIRLART
jgi:Holliday junction DNA helicase RuvA